MSTNVARRSAVNKRVYQTFIYSLNSCSQSLPVPEHLKWRQLRKWTVLLKGEQCKEDIREAPADVAHSWEVIIEVNPVICYVLQLTALKVTQNRYTSGRCFDVDQFHVGTIRFPPHPQSCSQAWTSQGWNRRIFQGL